MTTSLLKVDGMANLPANPLSVAMSFLEPEEVAQAERVCTSWKRVIGSPDQRVWKGICARDNIQVACGDARLLKEDTVLGTHERPLLGGFTPKILECIAEYAGLYKDGAAVLRANIQFSYNVKRFCNLSQLAIEFSSHNYDWGSNGVDEPFAFTSVYSSKAESVLPDAFPQLPLYVPFRLFIDKTGSFKNNGDKIRLVFQGKSLILTFSGAGEFFNGRWVTSLSQVIEERVGISLRGGFMSNASLETAKTLAKAAGDRIVVKDKKKSE